MLEKVINNLKLMRTFTIGHRFLRILITTDMNLLWAFGKFIQEAT